MAKKFFDGTRKFFAKLFHTSDPKKGAVNSNEKKIKHLTPSNYTWAEHVAKNNKTKLARRHMLSKKK